MSPPRPRTLARLLALLVVLSQSPFGAASLAGAHALVTSHGHDVFVRADADHVDLVLSHAPRPAADSRHAAERHLHAASAVEGGHVVHLTSGDALRDSLRRGSESVAAAFCVASFPLRSPAPREALFLPHGHLACAPASPLLVLRI